MPGDLDDPPGKVLAHLLVLGANDNRQGRPRWHRDRLALPMRGPVKQTVPHDGTSGLERGSSSVITAAMLGLRFTTPEGAACIRSGGRPQRGASSISS
jgi:hypothetical protein